MRRFDLDLLQALLTVADCGSLSAAAPVLCRSPSAVSEQVRKLEEAVGLPLLTRGKKGVAPTPAGQRLLRHARILLAANDAAWRDMQGVSLAGDLRLAITDYFRPSAIAGLLKRLSACYPRLRLHVSVRKSAVIEETSGLGEDFDIGLSMKILEAGASLPPGALPLFREPLHWVAAPSFAADFTWDGATPLPLVLLSEGCGLHRFVARTLAQHAIAYDVAHSASGVSGLQLALTAGLGLSCLNVSSIPAGIAPWPGGGAPLPALPDVEFSLMAPRAGESALVTEARQILQAELTA